MLCRQLEECKRSRGQAEPCSYLQTSQAQVLATKPNYQKILDEQGEVLSCMELVVSWGGNILINFFFCLLTLWFCSLTIYSKR